MQVEGSVAAVKGIGTKLLAGLLALMFVTCVYASGEDKKFSLKVWIENVGKIGELGNIGQQLVDAWTKNGRYVEDSNGVENYVKWSEYSGAEDDKMPFFEGIRVFFLRLGYSVELIAKGFLTVFDCIWSILPWNSTVPRGDPYV